MYKKRKRPRRVAEAYENDIASADYRSHLYFTTNPPREQTADRILAPMIIKASRQGHGRIEQALIDLWLRWMTPRRRQRRR